MAEQSSSRAQRGERFFHPIQSEALRLHRPGLMKRLWVYPSFLERSASAWEGTETEALRFRHSAGGKRFVPGRLSPVKRFNLNDWIPRFGGRCFSLGRSASAREDTKTKALGLPMGQRERSASVLEVGGRGALPGPVGRGHEGPRRATTAPAAPEGFAGGKARAPENKRRGAAGQSRGQRRPAPPGAVGIGSAAVGF